MSKTEERTGFLLQNDSNYRGKSDQIIKGKTDSNLTDNTKETQRLATRK